MFGMTKRKLEIIRSLYPAGTKVKCISMEDPYSPIRSGTIGEVLFVDDIGTIHVAWENGRRLGLVPDEDSFCKV